MRKINKVQDDSNLTIEKTNQNELRKLEQDFVDNKVANMESYIEKRKEEIVTELKKFAENRTRPVKWDRDGNPVDYAVKMNPLVINNYFFKSICPLNSLEPMYNAEKLALVFEYYMYIIAEINDILGEYPSSLTSFCKLAGITLNTLRSYRTSEDYNMRIIAEKIYDQIGDENITMGQLGMVNERSTLFKLRSQNEITEAQRPNVTINLTDKIDKKSIEDKIGKYKNLIAKKNRS